MWNFGPFTGGLLGPFTKVFSHYPSDYFPGGWNESIPLQRLGGQSAFPGKGGRWFHHTFFKAEIEKVNKDNLTIMANLEIP